MAADVSHPSRTEPCARRARTDQDLSSFALGAGGLRVSPPADLLELRRRGDRPPWPVGRRLDGAGALLPLPTVWYRGARFCSPITAGGCALVSAVALRPLARNQFYLAQFYRAELEPLILKKRMSGKACSKHRCGHYARHLRWPHMGRRRPPHMLTPVCSGSHSRNTHTSAQQTNPGCDAQSASQCANVELAAPPCGRWIVSQEICRCRDLILAIVRRALVAATTPPVTQSAGDCHNVLGSVPILVPIPIPTC
jgi:hypothetical protein